MQVSPSDDLKNYRDSFSLISEDTAGYLLLAAVAVLLALEKAGLL